MELLPVHQFVQDAHLIMLNAWWEPLEVIVPESLHDLVWQVEVDTADGRKAGQPSIRRCPSRLIGRSLLVLRSPSTGGPG